jgi:hypothetical protein
MVLWHLIFVGHQYGPCFMSPYHTYNFEVTPKLTENLCNRVQVHMQAHTHIYEGVTIIFWTDVVKIINLTTKWVWKLPTSTQLCATWHTGSLDMVVLPSTGPLYYHNSCIDDGTSPEYFGYTLVYGIQINLYGGWVKYYKCVMLHKNTQSITQYMHKIYINEIIPIWWVNEVITGV